MINNHRRITDDQHCCFINDVLTVSTLPTAYYPHFFPHFSVRPELSRRVIYVQPPNFSFVHGELVEPYTYIPTVEATNTIIQETTFTDASGEGVMRDVLFRYENTSTNKEGVYFDMDGKEVNCEARETTLGCGIQEKMLTWTDPNQWMVVKDLNHDGQINSGREVVGNQMILNNGTKGADIIQALSRYFKNYSKAA